ncbi:MAG: hypothetical protein AAB552_03375 [Patescibacteria group bacterium]
MRGKPITKKEIEKMVHLRETGHSLPEIQKIIKRGSATVFEYIKNVTVLPQYVELLKSKQGGSKVRAQKNWSICFGKAQDMLLPIIEKDKLLILAALYWGEGTKRELNIINSDPELLRVFVECLLNIGVTRDMLRVTLRIYEDMPEKEIRKYWAGVLKIPEKSILGVNILKGKKVGKLKYGMCRVRVTKGAPYFKLIMSMIELIKSRILSTPL